MESTANVYLVIWDIEEIKEFQDVKFVYASRDLNGIVHQLARIGLISTSRL